MAEINGSLQSKNLNFESHFSLIDPTSLILSQFQSNSNKHNLLHLQTESLFLERGPKYKAYADLRESKLRLKNKSPPSDPSPTPKRQVKFQGSFVGPPPRKAYSALAQSVPDFAAALRKENRKPAPVPEKSMTPPAGSRSSKMYGSAAKSGGSKSVNSGEKRTNGGGLMARKSYASIKELKFPANEAASAVNGNGENRGGRFGRTILGHKQIY